MKFSNSIKVLGLGVLAAGLLSTSFAANRVGPVSQYGQLLAGKNSADKGQIYGSCKGVADGAEVQVKGMSLYWSSGDAAATDYYSEAAIDNLVSSMNIQIVRFVMGISESWDNNRGYLSGGAERQKTYLNTVVNAAVKNDIYVIIDWHSHQAENQTSSAVEFFEWAAKTYGGYDNVIFEVYNEPIGSWGESAASSYWPTIKNYAESVIAAIRKHSDNLVVVGTPYYDQYPSVAITNAINDKNVAYTFHYYAASHSTGNEGAYAVRAMNGGLSVFVTEWGTGTADGAGSVNQGVNDSWQTWMNTHKLSWANWSASHIGEGSAAFEGGSSATNFVYTTSGNLVKGYLAGNPTTYTACSGTPVSSSSVASSSSSMPAGYTDYIDDLEDGDGYTFTGGEWYAYTDMADKGASTISNDEGAKGGYDVVIAGSKAGNSSKYVAGITGINLSQGDNLYDPYVALGLALNEKQTAYDLSACTQISYRYKGAAHNFKAEDTAVLDYAYHQIEKAAASDWTTATISWGALMQPSWTDDDVTISKKRINKFTWEVKGVAETTTQPKYNYLYVDDVRCSGWAIQPVPSPVSSSSSAKSSSSVASSSSAKSSSSVASSSSAKSSSSIASSSSAKSSSSVASSSSAKSSSSVASSSSVRSSSSAKSSSSAATQVVVVGDLEQTVAQGGQFETVTFKNVQTFNRNTWNFHFFNIEQSGSEVTVAGSVPNYVQVGDLTETLTINNTKFEIKLTVTAAASSSSASVENTSSSSVEGSSSSESTTVVNVFEVNPLKVSMTGRMLQVTGAERASVDVFDMQGSPVASFKQVTGSVSLENLRQGNYIVRVRSGSMNLTRRIAIK
ncbi:MAG: cellulase family glycosylhydrolase [Fibrobacter sp.]|uniref:cellulase family glycosylhydrolase n=1 Tax=Fibrobacter sp. TaxID=35828 RepID=UPI002A90B314|nr:cellulase family glycosylhydrolase [Fibrobacter sp.]MDY6265328.1 cellulase family glycosylhydrolase [Fibrobacter sp.]